jgi:hypothetical protein
MTSRPREVLSNLEAGNKPDGFRGSAETVDNLHPGTTWRCYQSLPTSAAGRLTVNGGAWLGTQTLSTTNWSVLRVPGEGTSPEPSGMSSCRGESGVTFPGLLVRRSETCPVSRWTSVLTIAD